MLLAVTLSLTASSHAERIGVDSFGYPNGPIANAASGGLWDWDNVIAGHTGSKSDWDVSGSPTVLNGALVTLNNSAKREYNGPGEGGASDEAQGAVNGANVARVVYYRVKITRAAGATSSLMSSMDFGADRVSFGIFPAPAPARFGIVAAGFGTNYSAITALDNQTYTLVAKIDYVGDVVALYVDPDLNLAEPGSAQASFAYTGTHWSTAVRLSGTGAGATTWDDLTVSTAWAELRSPVIVTTVADQDNGSANPAIGGGTSLREALTYSPAGAYISFDPSLLSRTIALTLGEMVLANDVTIDGSTLPGGITVNANNASRIFRVGRNVTLDSLTLSGGFAADGGAIHNNGPRSDGNVGLTVNNCTLKNNSATRGGAIFNQSKFTLNKSTLSYNVASYGGGGYYDDRSLFLIPFNNSTFSGNSAGVAGGAVFCFNSRLQINQCTLSGNSAGSAGGAIYNRCCADVFDTSSSACSLLNSIVSGNSAPTGPDLAEGTEGERYNFFPLTGTNLIGSLSGTRLTLPTNAIVGAPVLFPLGQYGGPTQTMPPRTGSLAINAAGFTNPGGTDQRGLPRFLNGVLDIGAVEAIRVTVQNTNDSGPGSLRQTIAEAPASAIIDFDSSLSGRKIMLDGTQLTIDKPLAISARFLANGMTIDAGGRSRIFKISANATGVNFDSLTLTGGKVVGDGVNASTYLGGAIVNEGDLALNNSTLHGNTSGKGGAIYNGPADGTSVTTSARLALNNSTLSGNTAVLGGAINNSYARFTLNHTTVSGNAAVAGVLAGGLGFFGSGGGIAGESSQETIIHNSIVAGNVSPDGNDLSTSLVSPTTTGTNLIGHANRELDPFTTIAVTNLRLSPLGHYGGPTPTMHPRQNSQAIDGAGSGPAGQVDQRGFARPVNGVHDIGAVEAGPAITVSNTGNSGTGSLRQAIADANASAGKRILFAQGLSGATINLTSGQLTISQPVVIDGSSLPARPTISAGGLSRILEISGPAAAGVALDSVTLFAGAANDEGGGIRNLGTLTLQESLIWDCLAPRGAGIHNSGVLQIHFSHLYRNRASQHGGGIYNQGILKIDKVRLLDNSATADGGGICNLAALDMQNSTLDENRANRGAGLFSDTDLTSLATVLKNCTLALNTAAQAGGGILNFDGLTTLSQCTISSNTAPANAGSGISSYGDTFTQTRVGGTILSGNEISDVDLFVTSGNNSFSSSGYNLVGSGGALAAFNNTGDLMGIRDPLLLPLDDYGGQAFTMHPARESRAIDAGGSTNPGGTDQRGYSRFVNGALDIGAVEAVFGPVIGYFAVRSATNHLEITYDLVDPETQFLDVVFDFSRDGGNTWAVATNATGAFGISVERGSRKQISWNALLDLGPVFTTQLRVRITVMGRAAQTTSRSSDNIILDTRPTTVVVRGRVLDSIGNPVPGALVSISSISNLPTVMTDSSGRYAVANVPRRGGTLAASKQTYSPQTHFIAPIAGIREHVMDDIGLTRLAFQVSDITRDIEGIYLGGDIPFEVRVTAHIDWGGRTRGHVNFYLGPNLVERVQGPTGDQTTITLNTANRTSGLAPYSTLELRAEAVAASLEVSQVARETFEFVGAEFMDALPFQVYQVGGFEPRYSFTAKWPPVPSELLDLGIFGKLGVDLTASLGMVYAPRSGEWELWLGDPGNVRSGWRPRGLEVESPGFVIGKSRIALATSGFASGQASRLGLRFNRVLVKSTLSYNQRLGELCVTDLVPGSSPSIRGLASVASRIGYDFNSLQCIRFDLDIEGTLELAAAAAAAGDLEFQDGSFTAGGVLSAYYKPDLGRFAEVLAKLSGGIALTLGVPNFEYRNTTLTAVAEITAKAKLPFLPSFGYGPQKWVLLDETFPSGGGFLGGGTEPAVTTSRRTRVLSVLNTRILSGMPTTTTPAGTFVANNNQASEQFSEDATAGFGTGGQAPSFFQTNLTLVQNASSRTSHALAARGSELTLVYTRPASPTTQELVWSRFNGFSWTPPAVVPGAVSAAILQPAVAYDGNGTAVVVWQQFRTNFVPGTNEAAVVGALELRSSRLADNVWSAAQFLTDNALYDGEPELCGILPDGDLLLIWRVGGAGDSFALGGTLTSRRWDSSTQSWGAPAVFDSNYGGTTDFTCASGGGKVVIAWNVDADGNFETATDMELYYRIWQNGTWSTLTRYTTDTAGDRTARVTVNASGTVFLAWLKNDQLVFSQDFGAPSVIQADPNVLGMADLHLSVGPTGNPLLLWPESFENGSDGRYAVYDVAANRWGQSALLWKDRDAERTFEIAWNQAGELAVTYLKERLVSTTQELTAQETNGNTVTLTVSNITETASVDLAFTRRALIKNLTIREGDFVVADEYFIPSNRVSMTVTLRNTGDLAVENPTVRFCFIPDNGSEIVISNQTFSGWMPAQSTLVFTATWVVPQAIAKGRLVAKADPLDFVVESDDSVEDNQKSVHRGGTDLAVAFKSKNCYPNGTARVIATVFNGGAPTSPAATMEIRRGNGSLVASAPVPAVAPGDSYDVVLDLERGFQQAVFDTYTVEINPLLVNDSDDSNNASRFSIYLTAEQLNPFPVTNGLQLRLTAQAGTSTTLDGAPVTSWIDQQNGHQFTNANITAPTYVADSGGGKPALDFTRNSGFIGNFSSTAGATIGDATIFVVGRFAGYTHPPSDASYWYSIDSSTGGSEHTLGRQEHAGFPNALYHSRGQPAQSSYYGTNIVEDPGGAFTLYTAIFRSVAGTNSVSALINLANGNLVNLDGHANSGYQADPSKTRIGLGTSNGNGLDGRIRELIIFNRVLTFLELVQVYEYLARQAAVTMPLTILAPPVTTTACVGESANFFVAASSTAVTYQWQKRFPGTGTFQNIPGANLMTYNTPTLTPGDDGAAFRVIVGGTGTNVTSAEALLAVISFTAPTIIYDFNDGLPTNTAIYGHAFVDTNTGVLELNANAGGQTGAFLTTDLAPGTLVHGFTAAFQARLEAGSFPPADGFSFNWATDLPNGTYAVAEEGEGSGLRVTFDTWDNGAAEAPAIEVWWGTNLVARRATSIPFLVRGADFFDVLIRLTPDGRLDMTCDCEPIFSRVPVTGYTPQLGARFGLGGRTAGAWEAHSIDDLALELYLDPTNSQPRITSINLQPPGGILIRGTGVPGRTYPIEASTDLVSWVGRANVVADPGDQWQLLEPSIATPASRFYRLQAAPQFPPGLVTWYRADGTFRDSYGPNHGTSQGGLGFAAGQHGQAFNFSGDASLLMGRAAIPVPWTAAFFVNRQDSPDISALLLSDNSSALKLEQASLTRQVGFTRYGVADYTFNYVVPANTWQHLTFVGTPAGTVLYTNGVPVATNAAVVNLPMHRLGRHENGSDRLKGLLDEVTLFNRALSPAEVRQVYNASRGP